MGVELTEMQYVAALATTPSFVMARSCAIFIPVSSSGAHLARLKLGALCSVDLIDICQKVSGRATDRAGCETANAQ